MSWWTRGTTKPWITIEQEHCPVPLSCTLGSRHYIYHPSRHTQLLKLHLGSFLPRFIFHLTTSIPLISIQWDLEFISGNANQHWPPFRSGQVSPFTFLCHLPDVLPWQQHLLDPLIISIDTRSTTSWNPLLLNMAIYVNHFKNLWMDKSYVPQLLSQLYINYW